MRRAVRARVPHDRLVGVEVIHLRVSHFELKGATGGDPLGYEILDHLGLRVDGHRMTAGQIPEVDAATLARELQVNAAVLKTLAVQPAGQPGLAQQGAAAV